MLIRSSAFKHSTEQFLYIFSTSFNLPSPPKIALNNQISEWDGWARINYLPRGFSGMCLPLFTHNFETDTSGEIFSIPLTPCRKKSLSLGFTTEYNKSSGERFDLKNLI